MGVDIDKLIKWADLVSKFFTLILSIIGAKIVHNQYKIQKDNGKILNNQYLLQKNTWRLALFEKRMAIYRAAMTLISVVFREGRCEIQHAVDLNRDTRDSRFLFGKDVEQFLKSIYDRAIDMATDQELLNEENVVEKRKELSGKIHEHSKWFSSRFEEANTVFGRYLEIHEE